jgi:UrcA family protein
MKNMQNGIARRADGAPHLDRSHPGRASVGAESAGAPQLTVKFADLSLSDPRGALRLYSRINTAANAVCRPLDIDQDNITARRLMEGCVHDAIAGAVSRIGQPGLYAAYNASYPNSPIMTLGSLANR